MTRSDVPEGTDEIELFGLLPADGSPRGNPRVRAQLDWDAERYWRVRDSLLDQGFAVVGRGRGGSLSRVVARADEPAAAVVKASARRGHTLYEPMFRVICGEWAKDKRLDPLNAAEITAMQGRRATGGRFTRPDIVVVKVKSYRYVPRQTIEVVTFEVKPCNMIDVTAVYEALAHRRSATQSYVVLEAPDDGARGETNVERVVDVAGEHGIGVYVVDQPDDYDTWDQRLEAVRVEPEPARLDEFLHVQLSDERAKEEIRQARR